MTDFGTTIDGIEAVQYGRSKWRIEPYYCNESGKRSLSAHQYYIIDLIANKPHTLGHCVQYTIDAFACGGGWA